MPRKGVIKVQSYLPESLSMLREIAYNLWWSYNHEYPDLLSEIDPVLFKECGGNPVKFLGSVSTSRLNSCASDETFMHEYNAVAEKFRAYMTDHDTWFAGKFPENKDRKIAYLSAEYGISEVLPTYSGGLGVLSGDHLKSASDMGLPLVGTGLFYKQGYFSQTINYEGWQQSGHTMLDPAKLPMLPVNGADGNRLFIDVDFPGRKVYLSVWQVNVGRIVLYFLDSDNDLNTIQDRDLTSSLYGGNSETRIQQELLMGVGGVRLLSKLGFDCSVYHLNEGHQAFVILELLATEMSSDSLTFEEASEAVRSKVIFTTHTPVPAGIDIFHASLAEKYLSGYIGRLGITREKFFSLAANYNDPSFFNMAAFAINFSVLRNGVSKLHGKVSRELFSWMWPDVPQGEVPITHVTNGIHTLSWIHPMMKALFDRYLASGWEKRIYEQQTWDAIEKIPDAELWETHLRIKREAVGYFRNRIISRGETVVSREDAVSLLDPDALTIGFARRFATYKRATLIFRDLERLRRILSSTDRPVQIIFAGKAHPADRQGQELIKRIIEISRQEGFRGRILFIENYTIEVARHLVQGVDIWLNNPRRPLEASGTSGQKASLNGVLNMSVPDGWWAEGFTGNNGFMIGIRDPYSDHELEDEHDSRSIYSQLENTVLPMYYAKDTNGIPHEWVKYMKESIRTTAGRFSSDRMLADYAEHMLIPVINRAESMASNDNAISKQLAAFRKRLAEKWPALNIYAFNGALNLGSIELSQDAPAEVFIDAYLSGLEPSEVTAQLCIEKDATEFSKPKCFEMVYSGDILNGCHRFHIRVPPLDSGNYIYSFRILPVTAAAINMFDLRHIRWA